MQCANGGSGLFCCTNGAENVDCCENGGSGPDCCTNGGKGQYCCANGADNVDCCDNGGKGQYCCTNGADNENCAIPTPPPLPSFIPAINLPKVIPLTPEVKQEEPEEPEFELDARIEVQTPPPVPSFVPLPNFPKVIPVASTPVPFAPRPAYPSPLPVKPDVKAAFVCPIGIKSAPSIQGRFAGTTKSPNEYLPPFDVRGRSNVASDWESWKVSETIH